VSPDDYRKPPMPERKDKNLDGVDEEVRRGDVPSGQVINGMP